MTAEFLGGLDPLDIVETRRLFAEATSAPPDCTPGEISAQLCDEVANLLYLLELAVRQHQEMRNSAAPLPRSRLH